MINRLPVFSSSDASRKAILLNVLKFLISIASGKELSILDRMKVCKQANDQLFLLQYHHLYLRIQNWNECHLCNLLSSQLYGLLQISRDKNLQNGSD